MRAVLYVRVSTTGQAEEGVSLKAQEARLRAWALANGAAEVRVFSDAGIGAGRMDNRPSFAAALAAVGKGDVLAVYSLSRLSRSTCDLLELADDLHGRGADLMSLSERIDTSGAAGKMIFRVLAVLCEFEKDQVSDRTKAALAFKRGRGEKTGGDRPFGYNVRGGRLFKNVGEQKIIQSMRRRRARGESLRTIGAAYGRHPEVVRRILARVEREARP